MKLAVDGRQHHCTWSLYAPIKSCNKDNVSIFYVFGHAQPNFLASLPERAFLNFIRIVMAASFDNDNPRAQYDRDLGKRSAFFIDGGVSDLGRAALHRCCKMLKLACDRERFSIFFCSRDHVKVTPYLLKLPHLKCVSIRFADPDKEPVVHSCLHNLHITNPQLSCLLLHHTYNTSCAPIPKMCAGVRCHVLQWGSTLQRLTLNNFDCNGSATTSRLASIIGGLEFLSQLQALLDLQLHDVNPALTTEILQGCTSLRRIILKGGSKESTLSLNLSSCSLLQHVSMTNYGLKALSGLGLPELSHLTCSSNSITQLDLSDCTALSRLDCSKNCLTALDTGRNQQLAVLDCSTNLISMLVLPGSPCLKQVVFKKCCITELSLWRCTGLQTLIGSKARIHTQELQACPDLRCLHIEGDIVNTSLVLASLPGLHSVEIRHSGITSLDVRDCTSLTKLVCANNPKLAIVDASGCRSIRTLTVLQCGVHAIHLTGCVKIDWLECSSSPELTVLDLSSCARLKKVGCRKTLIKALDVSLSACTLTHLSCRGSTALERLNVTGCSKLLELDCTECLQLEQVECRGCRLNTPLLFKKAGLFDGMHMGQVLAMDV